MTTESGSMPQLNDKPDSRNTLSPSPFQGRMNDAISLPVSVNFAARPSFPLPLIFHTQIT